MTSGKAIVGRIASDLTASLVASGFALFVAGVVSVFSWAFCMNFLPSVVNSELGMFLSTLVSCFLTGALAALAGGIMIPVRGTLGTAGLSLLWVYLLMMLGLDGYQLPFWAGVSIFLGGLFLIHFGLRPAWARRAIAETGKNSTGDASSNLSVNMRNAMLLVIIAWPVSCYVEYQVGYQPYNYPLMSEEGEVYRTEVIQFIAQNGRAPKNLSEAGLSRFSENYGPWKYHATPNGLGAGIHLGDYSQYGWEIGCGVSANYNNRHATTDGPIKQEAREIYQLALQYYLEHGVGPKKLEELGLGPDWGQYGPWTLWQSPATPNRGGTTSIGQVMAEGSSETTSVMFYSMSDWWSDT